MREIVLVAAGLIIGGFFGVTTMCLFQINRDRHYICRKDSDKNEQEKHWKAHSDEQGRSSGFAEKSKTFLYVRVWSYPFASQRLRAERKARRKILRCYAWAFCYRQQHQSACGESKHPRICGRTAAQKGSRALAQVSGWCGAYFFKTR